MRKSQRERKVAQQVRTSRELELHDHTWAVRCSGHGHRGPRATVVIDDAPYHLDSTQPRRRTVNDSVAVTDVLHAARLSEKQVITTPEHTTATP